MLAGLASDPGRAALAAGDLTLRETNVALATMNAQLGGNRRPVADPAPDDHRCKDRAWQENAILSGVMEGYLVSSQWRMEQLEQLELPEPVHGKARSALRSLLDATTAFLLLATRPRRCGRRRAKGAAAPGPRSTSGRRRGP